MAAKKQIQVQERTVQCAYMACQLQARVRVKVAAHAWSDFCERHYLEYHTRRAEETCHELALASTDAKRAYVILKSKTFARKWAA